MTGTEPDRACAVDGCTAKRLTDSPYCRSHLQTAGTASEGRPAGARTITTCWLVGSLLLLVGTVAMALSDPSAEGGLRSVEESGSQGGYLVGLVLLGVGVVVILVAAIATGVRLGMRAHAVEQRRLTVR